MIFRSLFAAPNSLILVYDHLNLEAAQEFESQVSEVHRFYKAVKLSELARAVRRNLARGLFAVAFRNARKSVFLHALPRLQEREIPFTVFLRPECIGVNRLPAEEELDLYHLTYPDKFPTTELEIWKTKLWNESEHVDDFLLRCRRDLGPLPVEKLEPTSFMCTWGKIKEVSPRMLEVGLQISANPSNGESLQNEMDFIEKQIGIRPKSAYCHFSVGNLDKNGFECVVTARRGMIENGTSVFDLPQWDFSLAKTKKNIEL